ncbi:hypothetical protein SY88_21265 [Clostridiales bacterium PH28_bin88]|nr:hypothetical protein SY88_21265 [Clostridiales bacterium PH28_bin88]
MFNLEKTSGKIVHVLFRNTTLSPEEKAKAEYGLSVLLGIIIELSMATLISLAIDTVFYIILIMLSALSLRTLTGGAHCSSYDRCLVFTLGYFLPPSVLAKTLHIHFESELLFLLSVALMATTLPIILQSKPYSRSILFPLALTAGASLLVNQSTMAAVWLSVALGLALQAFVLTKVGKQFVQIADTVMKKARI